MKKPLSHFPLVFKAIIILTLVVSCTKKAEEAAVEESNFTSAAVTKLSTVSANFTPDSLNSGVTTNSVEAMDESVCGDSVGLVDCQPNLLKLYLSISKQQLDMVTAIVSSVGQNIGNLDDGAAGSFVDGDITVQYTKTDTDNWSLTLVNAQTSSNAAYISVAGNTYTLELDFASLPTEEGVSTLGSFQSVVTYTDENTWNITSTMLDSACSDDDVRAPQNVRITMAKADGLWKGKAMLYHPRWAEFTSEPTCTTPSTDAIALNMFSDFVGDNSVSKMNVYMVKRTRALGEITSHPISDICNEYSICTMGMLGIETPASYANSVCTEAATGDSTWNSDCSSASGGTAVSAATFGSASDWIAPNSFYNMSITVGP